MTQTREPQVPAPQTQSFERLTLDQHIDEYRSLLDLNTRLDQTVLAAAASFIEAMRNVRPHLATVRKRRLIGAINRKFAFNKEQIGRFLDTIAERGTVLNHHEKARISLAFDEANTSLFCEVVLARGLKNEDLSSLFNPISTASSLAQLKREIDSPTLTRSDSKPRDWSVEIASSLFASYLFTSYPEEHAYAYFNLRSKQDGSRDYWSFLSENYAAHFSRERSLVYVNLDKPCDRSVLYRIIENEYERISNHGHLAIRLSGWGKASWRAAAYATLFAEKFVQDPINRSYFQWRTVEKETCAHVPLADTHDLRFDLADTGFTYRDTIVFGDDDLTDVVLLFQKNANDETLIPCPACRSEDVRGNSYSSFGVKSWECNNPLCPDRSKFNRGKRYSYFQLLKLQAIEDPSNEISKSFVRRWSRDVQPTSSANYLVEMLLRHYTLSGDGAYVVGDSAPTVPGRSISCLSVQPYLESLPAAATDHDAFSARPLFRRFQVPTPLNPGAVSPSRHVGGVDVDLGECFNVLNAKAPSRFDGAVTSPPYYNAREYAHWPNIYAYLFDMYNDARAVFRSLKAGAYYLYNIFDYFDNERTITMSAMGQKRLILSAYVIKMFEDIGFECQGNIVWDKGEIEGKRAFNRGNFSPFYQSPLNCWEHILIFRKPGDDINCIESWPSFLRKKPVFKMVRGKNVVGHTAPFPTDIPQLLLNKLPPNSQVLDPYAGSGTTGIASMQVGGRCVCVERDPIYFQLTVSRLEQFGRQQTLL